MKRFTHYLLATSFVFGNIGASAQESINSGESRLAGISAGDLTSEFVYDSNNRLLSVESLASKVTLDYSPVMIDDQEYDMTMTISDPTGDIICYLEIGENGYVSKSREIERVMDEEASYKTMSFTYDDEGRVTRINEIGIVDFSTTSFEYAGGNIITSETTGNKPSCRKLTYFSPDLMRNIDNTMGVMDFKTLGVDAIEVDYLFNAGLLGIPTTHLPVKSELTDGTDAYSYIWNIDNDSNNISRQTFIDDTLVGFTGYYGENVSGISYSKTISPTISTEYFDINGIRRYAPVRGINIEKTSGGIVKERIRF